MILATTHQPGDVTLARMIPCSVCNTQLWQAHSWLLMHFNMPNYRPMPRQGQRDGLSVFSEPLTTLQVLNVGCASQLVWKLVA